MLFRFFKFIPVENIYSECLEVIDRLTAFSIFKEYIKYWGHIHTIFEKERKGVCYTYITHRDNKEIYM